MGDYIETGRRFLLLSCTTLVERKSRQTAIDDRPEPMSSPINNPAYIAQVSKDQQYSAAAQIGM